MTLKEIVERARKGAKVPIVERDVERAFSALLSSEDIWRVIDLSQVPVMALVRVLAALKEEGLLTWDGGHLVLTEKGREVVKTLGIGPRLELKCPHCGGRGTTLGPVEKIADKFREIARNRPEAIQDYDQGYVTEETTLHRVAFMWSRGDLYGKELIVLGDDDLVSIAAGLTGAPKRIVVLEIDQRLVDFIRDIAAKEDLPIEVVQHDLREPLPPDLKTRFDTFFCDPTESLRGFKVFAERGIAALKGPGGAGYLGLTHCEASYGKWREIQRFLLEAGTAIAELRDAFHDYVNWPYIDHMRSWPHLPVHRIPGKEEIWYRSALIRIEVVEGPHIEERRYEGDIFSDEEAATT
ncbi:bis-aminopropyl spermidine synthase family protein [Candidatus Bipolaricaulota sp. J31]